ncbi:cysteine hydrolase family protein [Williamsia sp. R60]
MSVFNTAVDRVMRGLVAWRMRPQNTYHPSHTAVIVVAPTHNTRPDSPPNGVRLRRWARKADITVIVASRDQSAAIDAAEQSADRGAGGEPVQPVQPVDESVDLADNELLIAPFPGLSAFTNPALLAALTDRQIDRVIVAGARTEIEVDSTARDALEAGLHTTVVSDCCVGFSPAGHKSTIDITLPRLVHAVLTLDELTALTR